MIVGSSFGLKFLSAAVGICLFISSMGAWSATYVGGIPGAFRVTETGAATYSMPITVSPGVGGIQPNLTIAYSSQSGEGLAGTGWTLTGLSSITRCPKTVAQDGAGEAVKLDATDKFCLDGQRLVAIAGTYGANNTEYRTEVETFSKVVSYTAAGTPGIAWFKVWTKDGRILEYGNTTDSRIEAQGRADVLVWALNKTSDHDGNFMNVTYTETNATGEFYPARIDYAGAGLAVVRYVDFTYINRPWSVESYTAGAKSSMTKQLRTVRAWESGKKMREYTLRYYGGSNYDGSTQLAALAECTWVTGSEDCVYPTVMESYQPTFNSSLAAYPLSACADGSTDGNGCSALPENYHTIQYPDVNGDGQNDVCWRGNSGIACFVTNGNGGWNSSMITTTICANNSTADGGCDSYDNHSTIQFADFNADGAADLVFRSNSGIRVYTFNGSGFTYAFGTIACSDTDTSFGPCYSPNSISKSLTPVWDPNIKTIQYPDINGDGRADACYYTNTGFRCLLSTGTAFNSPVTTTICATGGNTPGVCNDAANFWTVRFADFDGDGKADLVYRGDQGIQVFRSTGTAFTHLYSTILCADGTNTYGTCNGEDNYHSARYADINADGKTDICFRADEGIRCALTTGTGVGTVITTAYCANSNTDGNCGFQFTLADINGDGMADLLYRADAGMRVRLSESNRFAASTVNFTDCATTDTNCDSYDNWATINLADLNGDGSLELVYRGDSGLRAVPLYLGRSLLGHVTNGLRQWTTIEYKPLTAAGVYTKGSGAVYPIVDIEKPMHVVSAYETNDGIGGRYRHEMTYTGARVDLSGRGFLGFSTVADYDTETGIKKQVRYYQDHPRVGVPAASFEELVNTRCKVTESFTFMGITYVGTGRAVIYPGLVKDIARELSNECPLVREVTTLNTYDTAYGNVTQIRVSTGDGYEKTTTNTYSNDATNWRIGRLTRSTVASKLPDGTTKTRTSSFGYDALGRLTSEIIEPDNPALRLTTTYTLDAYGNRIATTLSGQNVASRQSTIVYDASKRFAYQTQTRVGTVTHRVERTYDPFTGAVLTEKDANDFLTTAQYDPFGRKIQEDRPDGTRTTWQYRDCGSIVGCPARAKTEIIERTTGSPSKSVFSDFLNRPVRTAVEGFGGRWIHQDTEYDHRGFVRRTSLPYYANETAAWKTYTYDALGRVTQALLPDGETVRTSYQGLKTVLTNTRGFTTTVTKDSQGQVIEVDQSGSIVKYQYDHFGNLLNAIDPNGAVTRATYDLRGRKLSVSDPDRGNWRYEYNVFDEVVRQTDAKNQVTTYQYDTLGRLTKRSEPDLISDWIYDTAANGIGKLARATSSNGVTRAYTYDATAGRVTSVSSTIGGIVYTESLAYDVAGRVAKITYPATGFAVTNVFNAQGYLSEVKNAATGASYWRATAMDALGNITGESFGNGVTSSRTFNTYGWIQGISTNGSEGVVQSLRYNYDGEGNLGHRVDDGTLETFAYDDRNRLVSAASHLGMYLLITYDANGNIKSKSDVGTYNYGATRPHAVSSISGGALTTSFNYDANGNMTAGNGRALIYTSYNKPTRIFANGVVSDFNYDSSHVRVQKKTGTKTTTYVSKLFERTEEPNRVTGTGSWYERKHYIYAGSRLVAIYVDWNAPELPIKYTDYVHTDNLGSIHRLTDALGRTKTSFSYDPFGRPWDLKTGATRWQPHTLRPATRGYTGHEMDGELTLVNMGAREYDPVIGRFLQPDPISDLGGNTQAWNAYTYVGNNPLSAIDPFGLSSWTKFRDRILKPAVAVAAAVLVPPAAAGWAASAGLVASASSFGGMVVGGMAGGFVAGGVLGGNIQSALAGATTGAVFGAVGSWFPNPGVDKTLAHALAGGFTSSLNGGDFKTGLLSAGFAQGLGGSGAVANMGRVAQGIARTLIGGGAAVIAGGHFQEGVRTAAFAYLFNDVLHHGVSLKPPRWLGRLIFGPNFIGQGVSAGLAISYPGQFGGEWDIGVYGQAAGGGEDYGTGRYTWDILGFQSGSVRDMAGVGSELSFNDGIGGLRLNFDNAGSLNGIGLHIGPGINVGGAGTVTTTYTARDLADRVGQWW